MDKWKNKIIYQIWPRSFYDSNGDGIGDLQGIIQKLDYLQGLGIDLIWLSPIYLSPNKDYGYDISDYYHINPEYGTMADFDELLEKAHTRSIGIIMDLVANHTSSSHPWFLEALEDATSPYRDYYYFRFGKKDVPPNNWMSFFGGSAWTYDEKSNQYYLTQFTPHQCDLNWENPKVRNAIYEIMRFWLDKGIAGFRMDVINTISKAEGFPDIPTKKDDLMFPGELTLNRPKTHLYLNEMYKDVLSKYDCIAIGEGVMATPSDVIAYTHPENKELQMMFQFELHQLGYGVLGKYDFRKLYWWKIKDFKKVIYRWQLEMEKGNGWLGNYLSNHDQNRHISRFGNDQKYRIACAKAFCLLNFTLRGTPFLYQGEEIGMTDCSLDEEEWKDYEAINAFSVLQSMMHLPRGIAKKVVQKVSRDNSRTPLQWDDSIHAGFTTGTPWLKVNPNFTAINIAKEEQSNDSILAFYKNMIIFHKAHPVLTFGSFIPLLEKHPEVIAYIRESPSEILVILINLSSRKVSIPHGNLNTKGIELIHTTHLISANDSHKSYLEPFEGHIYQKIKK